VTLAEAQGQVDGLVASLRSQFPPLPPGVPASQVRLMPLREALFGRYATYVALVFAAATLVLLVGCANLASLLLVRARSRERRAAMQLALGASPGRLVQSAVIEAVLLAVIGTTLALAVLRLADQAIASWLPATFSRYAAPVFASRVLIFSVLLATGSALIAGILPGWRSARVDVLAVLQRGTGRAGSGRLRGSGALLAVEIAVSTLLVACAVLTGRTLVGLVNTSVGFNPNQLLSVSASLAPGKDPVQLLRQYRDMLEVIDHMPGVEAAAGADILPVIGAVNMPMFKGDKARGQRWAITERFVETMGMPIVAGRTLTAAEVEANAPVGLLSESGVRLRWPGVVPSAAVGRLLDFPGEASRQIVGVVSDVRYPYTADPFPSLYVPLGADGFRRMMFAVRLAPGRTLTTGDVVHTLREHGYVPTFARVDRVADNFAMSVVDQRFRAQLFLGFGVVAVVLAVIGVYAVQSFIVMLRLSEFGIRVSLGASPRDLWRMLILETMRPTVVGVVLGLIATVWAGQFLQAFLVGIQARDPWTFASVAVLLFFASALAAWVPARRASRTDPAIVLRAQ
jgi:putative ABC transport system permease protein